MEPLTMVGLLAAASGSDVFTHTEHIVHCIAMADEVSEALFKAGRITEEQHTEFVARSQAGLSKLAQLTADHLIGALYDAADDEDNDALNVEAASDDGTDDLTSLLQRLDDLL